MIQLLLLVVGILIFMPIAIRALRFFIGLFLSFVDFINGGDGYTG